MRASIPFGQCYTCIAPQTAVIARCTHLCRVLCCFFLWHNKVTSCGRRRHLSAPKASLHVWHGGRQEYYPHCSGCVQAFARDISNLVPKDAGDLQVAASVPCICLHALAIHAQAITPPAAAQRWLTATQAETTGSTMLRSSGASAGPCRMCTAARCHAFWCDSGCCRA